MTMRGSARRRGRTTLLLLAAWGAWTASPARADHTGVLQLNDRTGPYVLLAWSAPDPPRTDRCRVTIQVSRPGRSRAVPEAVVSVSAHRPGARPATVSVAADRSGDPAQVYHVADLTLPSPGRWTVTVRVTGPDGVASAAFPLDVEAPPGRPGAALLGAAAALGLVAVWLGRRLRWRARTPAVGAGQGHDNP